MRGEELPPMTEAEKMKPNPDGDATPEDDGAQTPAVEMQDEAAAHDEPRRNLDDLFATVEEQSDDAFIEPKE